MAPNDRRRWDEGCRAAAGQPFPAPDPLLFQWTPRGNGERRALDLAGGLGQNAIWLAEQGYIVDLADISRVALLRAQQEMAQRGLRNMNFFQVDLDEMNLQANTFDLICVFRFLKRELFSQMRMALRPGGRVIYETFNVHYLSVLPDFNPAFLLQPGELAGYFADWQIVHQLDQRYISQLVAIKPSASPA